MRIRNEALRTGSLLAFFHPEEHGRNACLLFLVKGISDTRTLGEIEKACQGLIDSHFGWYTVADQRDLTAVDPKLEPGKVVRFEVEEFRGLEGEVVRALLEPAISQLRRCELVRFPSATRMVGSVVKDVDLIGREEEVMQISRLLEKNQHVLMVAPRRSGKTALLYRLVEALKSRFEPVLVDAERFSVPEGLAAELLARTTKQPFTVALKEVRHQRWPSVLSNAIKALAGNGERPLVLMLDELVMHLEHVLDSRGDEEARELLRVLAQGLAGVRGRAIVAGSMDLEEFTRSRLRLELPDVFQGLHRFPLPPMAEDQLELHLRWLLLGTGLVLEGGDMAWLTRNVDLAVPYPAFCFLEHVEHKARERSLGEEDLDAALADFLATTDSFNAIMERLDTLAQKSPREFDALESVLDDLARQEEGLFVSDVRHRLSVEPSQQPERLYLRLMDGFPLRVEQDRVRLASRMFRRFWVMRQGFKS